MHFPPKFLQKPSPYFFMVHLLHCLYGVDAPASSHMQTSSTDIIVQLVVLAVHGCTT